MVTAARQEAEADLIAVAAEAIAGLPEAAVAAAIGAVEAAAAIAAVVAAVVTADPQAEVVAVLAVVVAVALADLRTHRAVGRTAISK